MMLMSLASVPRDSSAPRSCSEPASKESPPQQVTSLSGVKDRRYGWIVELSGTAEGPDSRLAREAQIGDGLRPFGVDPVRPPGELDLE